MQSQSDCHVRLCLSQTVGNALLDSLLGRREEGRGETARVNQKYQNRGTGDQSSGVHRFTVCLYLS